MIGWLFYKDFRFGTSLNIEIWFGIHYIISVSWVLWIKMYVPGRDKRGDFNFRTSIHIPPKAAWYGHTNKLKTWKVCHETNDVLQCKDI